MQGAERMGIINDPSHSVIGAAIEVHRALGPGLLESAYEACLCEELAERGISYVRQQPMPVTYKSKLIDCGYRPDLVVDGSIIVELKAIEAILPLHKAQILTYMRLAGIRLGLLINFNVPVLRKGISRFII